MDIPDCALAVVKRAIPSGKELVEFPGYCTATWYGYAMFKPVAVKLQAEVSLPLEQIAPGAARLKVLLLGLKTSSKPFSLIRSAVTFTGRRPELEAE